MSSLNLEQFLESVTNHQLTVNVDQGLYRDLTIGQPNTGDRRYHITTRPGYLIFTGDMGSFVFTRLPDMFRFFRDAEYRIQPSYWSEKLEAVDSRSKEREFDTEKVRAALYEDLEEFLADLDPDEESDIEKMDAAREAIDNLINYTDDDEWGYVSAIRDWNEDGAGGLCLSDFWEHQTTSWTRRYIWACYAIVHAIKLYDAHTEHTHKGRKEVAA